MSGGLRQSFPHPLTESIDLARQRRPSRYRARAFSVPPMYSRRQWQCREQGADMNRLIAYPRRMGALLLSICALPVASHAESGVIRFSGRIVAPPYEIRAVPAAIVRTAALETSGADLVFSSSPSNRPSAKLQVEGLPEHAPLTLRYLDAKGAATALLPGTSQRIGPNGGTLFVTSGPGFASALVSVTYN
ncbi:hypothetical protein Rmet_1658 [Cupriavidus metallidurans CH34]|uniref:Uncharacterized protein n=2 Tax=Cupriavidus metallidurans TaxID=119219 RepID=Q1LMT5_CUPMC|nr:hypothetical protein Rmet_1658 [Cupriavidus metallidurans CH34]